MKKILTTISIVAAAVMMMSCAQENKQEKLDTKGFSYAVAVSFGDYLASMHQNTGVEIDVDMVAQAIKDALEGNLKMDTTDAEIAWQEFLSITLPAYKTYVSTQFVETAAKKKGAQKSPSGLVYMITDEGEGAKATPDNVVTIKYSCQLADGTVVVDNITERLNVMQLIPGFMEGLQMLGKGGSIKLWIPENLAFGSDGNETLGILAYEALYIDVKMEDIQ